MMAYRDYQEFNDWIIKDWVKNDNIARAYLAGKALGVDLVKVGEDEKSKGFLPLLSQYVYCEM